MQRLAARAADAPDGPAGAVANFEQLIGPHINLGYRLAATMLGDRGEAEDAVQEAAMRAWRAHERLRPDSSVRAWFLTIVANQCRARRRTRWWSTVRVADAREALASPAETADRHADLVNALRRLGPVDRAAILLRFYEDMTSEEVGHALGITATGARSRIKRALHRLRVDLGGEEL